MSKKMSTSRFFILFLLLALNAHGHEFLTQMLVTTDGNIKISPNHSYQIIDTFYLDENDLTHGLKKDLIKQEIKRIAANRNHHVNPENVICDDWDVVLKTCGVFDHFNEARSMAIDICTGLAVTMGSEYAGLLIPQFMGPSTFIESGNAASDHHDLYHFSHGLTFNCVEVVSNLETE